ncbi:MAG: hypothetical protein AAGK04_04500 [Planctomycetota bacterium]
MRAVEREWPIWDDGGVREAMATRSREQIDALASTFEALGEAQWAALERWFAAPIVGDGWPTIDDHGLCLRVQWAARLAAGRPER